MENMHNTVTCEANRAAAHNRSPRQRFLVSNGRQRFARRVRGRPTPRTGGTSTGVVVTLTITVLVGWATMQFAQEKLRTVYDWFTSDAAVTSYITAPVIRGPFVHEVLERGEIESSSNIEIRCEVRSRSSAGTTILEIVPEGTVVQPGDLLARLDDAALQQELIQQQIVVSNSESAVIEAQATLDAAQLALKEYENGTFPELIEQQESEVFVAEENLRRAEEYLRYSKRLAERGYIPETQLEADTFAVSKARKDLGVAKTKLDVLRQFTRQKMLTQLNADIATAQARLKARQKTLELDRLNLKEIETQIARCRIVAPVAGEVVYANDPERRSSSGDLLIAEGRPVRERQVMFRIPDNTKMRVIAKVHESRISFVRPGLTADIVLDALPDLKLSGQVVAVGDYPIPSYSIYMAHIKEYSVEIEIENPPTGLRPGMTAQVNILVQQLPDAVQVPISAVIERAGRFFCAVPGDNGLETRELSVVTSNEDVIVVDDGVRPGESVVLNVRNEAVLKELTLPETPESPADEFLGSAPAADTADDTPAPRSSRSSSTGRTSDSRRRDTGKPTKIKRPSKAGKVSLAPHDADTNVRLSSLVPIQRSQSSGRVS